MPVFFDLDGTLLDTAPDLADACNRLLLERQRSPIDLKQFREWVHGGTAMMICESFGIETSHPDFSKLKTAFLDNYQQRLTQKTRLFPGIDKVLSFLEQQQIPWGVVTNKQAILTQPLLAHFGLAQRCCCIVSGDTLTTTKPHPAPLLHACKLAQAEIADCIYVGDTLGDIQAARAAGMRSIAVDYGYRPSHSLIETWQADALASTPSELLNLLYTWKNP